MNQQAQENDRIPRCRLSSSEYPSITNRAVANIRQKESKRNQPKRERDRIRERTQRELSRKQYES